MSIQLRESAPALTQAFLRELEARLGITLPADYRSFLLRHNGGTPRANWFSAAVRDEWQAARRSEGRLKALGQMHGNDAARQRWNDWHRVRWFYHVGDDDRIGSGRPDLERAYRSRPPAMPVKLLPIAETESFQINGWLCIDVSAARDRSGAIYYCPDVFAGADGLPAALVARSFDEFLESLSSLGKTEPEWLPLVQEGDLESFRHWLGQNASQLRDKDLWGWTSLDHTVFEGKWDIVRFLLEKRDVTPSMILFDAMNDGRYVVARGMLGLGVDAEFIEPALARKEPEFWTDGDTVRAFLEAGADVDHIDSQSSRGNTPLHFAARAGAIEAVRLLLARGADPTIPNAKGDLPRDLAMRAKHAEIAELLEQAAAGKRAAMPGVEAKPDAVDLHGVELLGASQGLDDEAIERMEQRQKTQLPSEYRALLRLHHGGTPRPAKFSYRDEQGNRCGCEITEFLQVESGEATLGDASDVESARDECEEWGLASELLPIARFEDEHSDGFICMSLRGKNRGAVFCFWMPRGDDSATQRIARNLSEFFALLSKAKAKSKAKVPDWVAAIERGDLGVLDRWYEAGGQAAWKTRYRGKQPVALAVEKGRTEVVRWLIARGVKAKAAYDLALEAGAPEVLLDLLDLEEVRTQVEKDVLLACRRAPKVWRSSALVRALIGAGADVNALDDSRMTPLLSAAQYGTPEVVRLLIASGARAGAWSNHGEMAIHRAALAASRSEMIQKIQILIDAGESINARAPQSTIPDEVTKKARALEIPIGEILEQGGPQASLVRALLGSIAKSPEVVAGLLAKGPVANPYLAQYQRSAADVLREIRKDVDAVAELEAYESSRRA
jgi:ankyrin repeat protein/cell wall assembly regulator SMI1